MVSTFHGLEVGKRGLMVGQASIATTGHNIANANTKGYSRQQVNATTTPSLNVWTNGSVNPGQLGTGVALDSITRVRDKFLDERYRDQSSKLGEATIKQDTLDQLETIINEPSETGLNSSMDQLWAAWQDLANEPDSLSAKAVIKERAQAFIDTAQAMNSAMTSVNTDLDNKLTAKMNEANGYLEQIASLNDSIKRNGSQSNDLLDKLDVMVEELSKIADIAVVAQTDGTYQINLSSGEPLVSATGANKLAAVDDGNPSTIVFTDTVGGELGGILQSKTIVDGYQAELNTVVQNFVSANEMTNSTDPTLPGEFLFTGATIDTLEINTSVQTDSKNITALRPGMEAIFKSTNNEYRALVSKLGAQSQTVMRNIANYEASLQATDNRRQSVTGVSLDEEMANLIKYQHSYSAAARMISTTDQMLDTIINRMAAR